MGEMRLECPLCDKAMPADDDGPFFEWLVFHINSDHMPLIGGPWGTSWCPCGFVPEGDCFTETAAHLREHRDHLEAHLMLGILAQ